MTVDMTKALCTLYDSCLCVLLAVLVLVPLQPANSSHIRLDVSCMYACIIFGPPCLYSQTLPSVIIGTITVHNLYKCGIMFS